MSKVLRGRYDAEIGDEGAAVFLIGMRINVLWRVSKWVTVAVAMSKMVTVLVKSPSLGLLSRPRTYVWGRTVMLVQSAGGRLACE